MSEQMKEWIRVPKNIFLIVFLGCVGLLSTGFVLQYAIGLVPCILCILQRFFFAFVGITALFAVLSAPRGIWVRVYAGIMGLFALLGGLVAFRQVWLQHTVVIDPSSTCVVWLGSVSQLIFSVFSVSKDCAERGWTLLSLSIPEWSLIAFSGLLLISGYIFWLEGKKVDQELQNS